jgi:hypothetical protein
MGTRNVTMVVSNSQTKVAQYGQWDGYPSGNGVDILKTLKKISFNKFKKKVDALCFLTDEQTKKIDADPNWVKNYPYLNRDAGARILEMVYKQKVIGLVNNEEFINDGLDCEWAYVIDLDKRTFEVYKGRNKKRLQKGERFYKVKQADGWGYYPAKHVKTFSLDSLPTDKEFLELVDL